MYSLATAGIFANRYLIAGTKVNLSLESKVVVDPEGEVTYIHGVPFVLFVCICVRPDCLGLFNTGELIPRED